MAYLRKSTKSATKQEASLDDQRAKVLALCDLRGWIVSEWFVESASATKNRHLRKELDRLLVDLVRPGRSWAGVVVWRWDRLSRSDSLDQATAMRLRDAGVWLESTTEGRADWTSSIGRITWALKSEQSHEDVVKLSEATVGGRTSALADGYWTAGKVPWGYDRRYVRPGHEDVELRRRATAGRPVGYRLKLKVNEQERPLVEAVYRLAVEGVSLHGIARRLTTQGVETAHGSRNGAVGGWTAGGVSVVLRNPAYKGDLSARGNHKSRKGGRRVEGYYEDVVPAIVDPETWKVATENIGTRKRKSTATYRSGVLSGIVTCGHCGLALKKQVRKQKVCAACGEDVPRTTADGTCLACGDPVGTQTRDRIGYTCHAKNSRPGRGTCPAHSVEERPLLDAIRSTLFGRVEAEVLHKALTKPADPTQNVDLVAMKKAVEERRRAVTRASDRMMSIEDDIQAEARASLRKMKAELQAAEASYLLASTPDDGDRSAARGWLEDLRDEWVSFGPAIEYDDPKADPSDECIVGRVRGHDPTTYAPRASLTALLRRLGVHVAVHWTPKGGGRAGEVPTTARIDARFDVPVGALPVANGRTVCTVDLLSHP